MLLFPGSLKPLEGAQRETGDKERHKRNKEGNFYRNLVRIL